MLRTMRCGRTHQALVYLSWACSWLVACGGQQNTSDTSETLSAGGHAASAHAGTRAIGGSISRATGGASAPGSSFAVGGNTGGNTTRIVAIGGADSATSSIAGAVAWGGTGSSSTQENAPGGAGATGGANAMTTNAGATGDSAAAGANTWGGASGVVEPSLAGQGGTAGANPGTTTSRAGASTRATNATGGVTLGSGGHPFVTGGTSSVGGKSGFAAAGFGNDLDCANFELGEVKYCSFYQYQLGMSCDFRSDPVYPRRCFCELHPGVENDSYLLNCMGTARTASGAGGANGAGGAGGTPATLGTAGQPEPSHANAILSGGDSTCVASTLGRQCLGYGAKNAQAQPLLSRASSVAISDDHWCAIDDGQVSCWGANSDGQLGDGSTTKRDAPLSVAGLQPNATAVATASYCEGRYGNCGNRHYSSCALIGGNAYCWGWYQGQKTTAPVSVDGLSGAVQMIAIGRQSCALVADGVKCWDNSVSAPIVEIEGLTSGVTRIAAGGSHNCAVVSDGLRCWGDNTYGQLGGTGDGVNPVVVFGLGSQVTDVALGTIHSCALVAQGVQCWGANQYGQLGNDTQVNSSVPVPVYGLESNVVAIASGSYHTCALTAAGEVLCWGANDGGQLGNPYVGFSLVPEVVRLP